MNDHSVHEENKWFTERLHDGFSVSIEAQRVLFEEASAWGKIAIIENQTLGKVLFIDDIIQLTEFDEYIYHESLSHVPILAHGNVKDVLIIGGGDGGMLKRVLMHEKIESVTQVEISDSVVNLSKKYFPNISEGAFEDPRVTLLIEDGKAFVDSTESKFDVIITDLTDPIGPAEELFKFPFYESCKKCLKPDGILVTQNGVPHLQGEELRNTITAFKQLFLDAACYLGTVPTYVGGPMAYGWGTDNRQAREVTANQLQERLTDSGITTRYYTPELHVSMFTIPKDIREIIK